MSLWFRFHAFCESEICPVLLWDVGSLVWDAADSGAVLLIAPSTNPPCTLCLCPKGVACFVLAALLLCTDRCISAQQASGAGAVNWTDNRSRDGWGPGICSGWALNPVPWKLHSFALGLNILETSTSQILCDHFISLRVGQACRSHCLWIWLHFAFYLWKQGR